MKTLLEKTDKIINDFLSKNIDIMPMRLVKLVAFYYTDARIRKLYLNKIGVVMDEGTYTNLGFFVTMNDDYTPCVYIGKNVSIAPNVTLLPNSEPNNSKLLQSYKYVKENLIKINSKIIIEDDVWLGSGCTILPGIRIRKGTIIGAGAVVTEDTDEFSIYAGVPAKKIRSIKDV